MSEYTTNGNHLLLDIWLKSFDYDIFNKVDSLLKEMEFSILETKKIEFDNKGETAFWVLTESHCSIHTYPEYNYFSLDVYSCDTSKDLKLFIKKLFDLLGRKNILKISHEIRKRGIL